MRLNSEFQRSNSFPIYVILIACLSSLGCKHECTPCKNEINLQSIVIGQWIWEETIRESNDGWSDTLNPQTENIKYAIEIYQEENCSFISVYKNQTKISSEDIYEYDYNDTYFDDSRIQSHGLFYGSENYFDMFFLSHSQSFELNDSIFFNGTFPFSTITAGDTAAVNRFRRE